MATLDRSEQERALASKRRQAYYRNRRTIQQMERRGTPLEVARMSVPSLTAALGASLVSLLLKAADGTSPIAYADAQDALACYEEIIDRGEQLRLI